MRRNGVSVARSELYTVASITPRTLFEANKLALQWIRDGKQHVRIDRNAMPRPKGRLP